VPAAAVPPLPVDVTVVPDWFYARGGQRVGPISISQLKALAVSEQLRPSE